MAVAMEVSVPVRHADPSVEPGVLPRALGYADRLAELLAS